MRSGASKTLAILLSLVALVAAALFVRELLTLYRQAQPEVRLGVITALGSALAFIVNNVVQNARERKARLFESKREAYSRFFTFFMSFFHRHSGGGKIDEAEIIDAFRDLTTSILTWGSPETIAAFNRYQEENATKSNVEGVELFSRAENFLRALRKDLGHNDSALEDFGLTKLFVKGDEHKNFAGIRRIP